MDAAILMTKAADVEEDRQGAGARHLHADAIVLEGAIVAFSPSASAIPQMTSWRKLRGMASASCTMDALLTGKRRRSSKAGETAVMPPVAEKWIRP